jgi:hypothetical protein
MKRPNTLYFLVLLHILLGSSATIGGVLLMLKPDGSLLGMQAEWLKQSPFQTYSIPGFILLTCNGFLPLFTAVGLLFKPKGHAPNLLNIYPNRYWAWAYSLYSGIIIITWIAIQLILTDYFWLQPVMILVGLLMLICTLTPSIMKHYEKV